MKSLTLQGKIFFTLIIGIVVVAGIYYGGNALKKNGTLDEFAKDHVAGKLSVNTDADLVVAYNTFIGVAGLVYMNGGMEPNTGSPLYKQYGIKLQIKQMDGLNDTRDALKTGAIDAAYCTVDALSIEMGNNSSLKEIGAKVRMKVNESRGADALVVNGTIKTVSDLKGKTVAYAVGTASNTLLLNILETAGLDSKDITFKTVTDGIDAANAFKSGSVDAALVWAPDDEDCIKAIKGAKILSSTKIATSIIADGLLITDQRLEEKHELLVKLVKAWLEGNSKVTNEASAKAKAIELFSKGFGTDEIIAKVGIDKVRLNTLGDNQNFFDLNSSFTGITGSKMYTRMGQKYTDAGLVKGVNAWSKVSDSGIIEEIANDKSFASSPNQAAESEVKFTAPTVAEEKAEAVGTKRVTINFATASYQLDDAARTILDREVVGVAQGLGKARIRVEGNTDITGDKQSNVVLSYKRAEAVVKYLVSEHGFDRNKFIVVGNGQSKPLCTDNTPDCYSKNRRTEFQFIW